MGITVTKRENISSGRHDICKQKIPKLPVILCSVVIFIDEFHTKAAFICFQKLGIFFYNISVIRIACVICRVGAVLFGTCIFAGMVDKAYAAGVIDTLENLVVIACTAEITVAVITKEAVDMGIVQRRGIVLDAKRHPQHASAVSARTVGDFRKAGFRKRRRV